MSHIPGTPLPRQPARSPGGGPSQRARRAKRRLNFRFILRRMAQVGREYRHPPKGRNGGSPHESRSAVSASRLGMPGGTTFPFRIGRGRTTANCARPRIGVLRRRRLSVCAHQLRHRGSARQSSAASAQGVVHRTPSFTRGSGNCTRGGLRPVTGGRLMRDDPPLDRLDCKVWYGGEIPLPELAREYPGKLSPPGRPIVR